ncbi:hypothetical protein GCM10009801_78150 [Streptomyces albiaxialis]|uniref:Ferric oxidoreductase domain-containing protein n=1 Tax=Streptomyces albiaxialis TaxID=329523 RepID=A0ABP5IMI6_9ACTN
MSPQQLPSQQQRSPAHRSGSGRRRAGPRPGPLHAAFGAVALLALGQAVTGGVPGRAWAFLDQGAGVLALVALTATVLWGLAATDRILLRPAHRLLAQGVHRGTAVGGLCFLALHIWVKVAEDRTSAAAAAVPLTDRARPLLIGLGTLAGYLFVAVAVTGVVRAAFANGRGSRWWRALHMCAYPAWGAALVHGLRAGRHANGWVTAAYVLCLAGTSAVLIHRLLPHRAPARSAATGADEKERR